MKRCEKCKEIKDDESFYRNKANKSGLNSNCKDCDRTRLRKYHRTHKDIVRFTQIKYMYGLTIEQWSDLFKSQKGKCAICDRKIEARGGKKVHIDHDHKTGKVRGILCSPCNRALGMFRENTETLSRAITYLKRGIA